MLDKFNKVYICNHCGEKYKEFIFKCLVCGGASFEIKPKIVTKEKSHGGRRFNHLHS